MVKTHWYVYKCCILQPNEAKLTLFEQVLCANAVLCTNSHPGHSFLSHHSTHAPTLRLNHRNRPIQAQARRFHQLRCRNPCPTTSQTPKHRKCEFSHFVNWHQPNRFKDVRFTLLKVVNAIRTFSGCLGCSTTRYVLLLLSPLFH
jgi:hypothetical protein